MQKPRTIIFLADGMADEPLAELGGLTPLEHAKTPAMDSIAENGCSGTLLTLPEPWPTSSDVANMSVLGCDLATEYCGRGPLEAVGRGVNLVSDDIAFRANLTSVEDGVLKDFSGGHPDQESASRLITELNKHFASDKLKFYEGVSYRHILVLSGKEYSPDIRTEKPDDNHGERVDQHMPEAINPEAYLTISALTRLIKEAPAVLEASGVNHERRKKGLPPINGLWPWSGGRAGSLKTVESKYGITGTVVSAVDVIMGLGRSLGMDVIHVPGATGYIDTNYEGKADAAIEGIKNHELVYLHVEAIDEVSHAHDLEKKMMAIEDFDSRVVGRVLNSVHDDITAVVLPDHPVPIALGKHTRIPVPVSVRMQGHEPDAVRQFSERACPQGSLGAMTNGDLMNLLFKRS